MNNNEVVLFGASCGGIIAHDIYQDQYPIVAFCDNDEKKWGQQLKGLPIIGPDQLQDGQRVIIASVYLPEIISRLGDKQLDILWPESMAFSRNLEQHIDRCLADYLEKTESPVLIYQMGKVGSISIERMLQANSLGYFSAHHLNDEAAELLKTTARKKPLRIITIVREAIARDISALFQFFPDTMESNRSLFQGVCETDVTNIMTAALKHGPNTALNWLTEEFEHMLGINIYDYPFDPAQGYTRIQVDNLEILVVRLESVKECQDAITDFLGIEPMAIPHENKGSRKWYACLYDEFRAGFSPDAAYLDQVYDSLYMRHFYSDDEIAKFRAKWQPVS